MSKILIVYWSGTGNTEKMAELVQMGAQQAGAEVTLKRVSEAMPDEIKNYDILAMGSPAMGAEVIEEEEMEPFVQSISDKVAGKKVALFGSYGWGEGEWMESWHQRMLDSGALLFDSGLTVRESPEGTEAQKCVDWGEKLAAF